VWVSFGLELLPFFYPQVVGRPPDQSGWDWIWWSCLAPDDVVEVSAGAGEALETGVVDRAAPRGVREDAEDARKASSATPSSSRAADPDQDGPSAPDFGACEARASSVADLGAP
jgi:hypothetical protein